MILRWPDRLSKSNEIYKSFASSSEIGVADCVNEFKNPPVGQVSSHKSVGKHTWFGYTTHTKDNCPAMGSTCRKCNGRNHFARVCKLNVKKASKVNEVADLPSTVDSLFGAIDDSKSLCDFDQLWNKLVQVAGIFEPVKFILDTGVDVSVIPSMQK